MVEDGVRLLVHLPPVRLPSLAPLHKLDWRSPYPSAVLAAPQ
jgi:hypothetical protein